ncbi:MAG: hypothetical protein R6V85_20595 [Polyangia bacterium]
MGEKQEKIDSNRADEKRTDEGESLGGDLEEIEKSWFERGDRHFGERDYYERAG